MGETTILVIEDDPAVRRGVVDALEFAGYRTLEAGDGESGLDLALRGSYRLLLLDLVLPGRNGFSILEELKKRRAGQPVIILSARGEENDRVRGLELGADDYVMKPFSVRELLARVEAVLRRTCEREAPEDRRAVPGARVGGRSIRRRRGVHQPPGGHVVTCRLVAGPVVLLALLSAAACGPGEPPRSTWTPSASDWPAYGGDAGGTRYAALGDITRENVRCLERAWTHHTGDLPGSPGCDFWLHLLPAAPSGRAIEGSPQSFAEVIQT